MLFVLCVVALHAAAAGSLGPRDQVIVTSKHILTIIGNHRDELRRDPQLIYAHINEILLPHFDFERMARWVLGKYWRPADEEQRKRFVEEFRSLLVRTYGSALLDYENQQIVYLPLRARENDTDVTVRTEIHPPGGGPIPVNYRMYLGTDGWKVHDVTIDNVSLVTNYRNSFANEIRRNGLDTLISKLAERNRPVKE